MTSYAKSLKILRETKALIDGHFILSSGLHSPRYVQCAQLLSNPTKALSICRSLAAKIKKGASKFDIILSPAMGGIIIGYEIVKLLKTKTIFAERENNIFRLRRNFFIKKKSKVLIVEDVITTGKSSLECKRLVSRYGAKVSAFACIIDRTNGKSKIKEKIISQVKLNIPSYKKQDLPKALTKIKPIKPGSRKL
jgi:orotate phosphoribosyltransferase